MNFSICLIAKNEEKTLPRLLESLSEFIKRDGKVLLLDTGSTDNTVDVAKQYGCEVHEVGDKFVTTFDEDLVKQVNEKFLIDGEEPIVKVGDKLFDYASARNYIAEFVETEMIATPDCDEVYTKLDLDKINEVIANGKDQLEYNFVFSHDEFGQEAIKFLHCKFYNRKKFRWVNKIHEVLQGSGEKTFLDESIIKLEHYQNVETNRSGYLKGLALDCLLNPTNDRNSHYFGRELLWTGRYKSAISELVRHLELSTWKAERGQSMIYIGDAFKKLQNEDGVIDWYTKAFREEPNRREALIRLAEYYYEKNNHLLTAVYAEACLPIPLSSFYANSQEHYTSKPHELLYWAYWYLGDKIKAKYHFDMAIHYNPYNHKFIEESKLFYDYPPVSIIIPNYTRDTAPLVDSLVSDNYSGKKEIIIQKDETGEGCPKTFNKGVEKATHDLVVFLGDDCVVEKNWLNHAVMKYINTGDLIALNDGMFFPDWQPKLASHFLAHKTLRNKLQGGHFFDERIRHYGCDDFLTKQVQKIDKLSYAQNAVIRHQPKSDDTSEKAARTRIEDIIILENLMKTLR